MTQTQTVPVGEQLSALVDGQLQGEALERLIGELGRDAELRASWQTYHLVGDVLRTGTHSACSDPSAFLARLQGRLADEPRPVVAPLPIAKPEPLAARAEAANEPLFRWKLVAGFASLAAAAAVGWNWIGLSGGAPAPVQLAFQQPSSPLIAVALQQPSPLSAAVRSAQPEPNLTPTRVVIGNGSPQVMLRDPRLDQLLEAHQQAGGVSLPAGFLRNATFEHPSR